MCKEAAGRLFKTNKQTKKKIDRAILGLEKFNQKQLIHLECQQVEVSLERVE